MACQSCGRVVPGSGGLAGSIFYCPRCNTEDTYCDSTNRIFCPHCGNYVKDQE
ncbi:MAG: hypothetical protein ACXWMH_07985 [Syntrophales bacterium]